MLDAFVSIHLKCASYSLWSERRATVVIPKNVREQMPSTLRGVSYPAGLTMQQVVSEWSMNESKERNVYAKVIVRASKYAIFTTENLLFRQLQSSNLTYSSLFSQISECHRCFSDLLSVAKVQYIYYTYLFQLKLG